MTIELVGPGNLRVLVGLVGLFLGLALGGSASAQGRPSARPSARAATLWELEAQRLHDEVVRDGQRPGAVIPLMELGSAWEAAPTRTLTLIHALAEDRRLLPSLRLYARTFEISLLGRAGRAREAEPIVESLGFVRRFRALGPFSNEGRHGLETLQPPERDPMAASDLDAEVPGAERGVRWRTLPQRRDTPFVRLDPFFTPSVDACVFLETFVRVDRARPLALGIGASGAVRVYWNGQRVHEDTRYRGSDVDRSFVRVAGRAGWNRFVMKLCGASAGLEAIVRVAEADGAVMSVVVDPAGARAPAAAGAPVTLPTTPLVSIADALEAELSAAPEDAHANETLARYLDYTNGEDPSAHRARDLAVKATEVGATVRNLLFAARLQSTRDERLRLVQRAVQLAPHDPEALLEEAFQVSQGASGERALAMLTAIPPTTVSGLLAQGIRANLLEHLDFAESAYALRKSLLERAPDNLRYVRIVLAEETDRGHVSAADALRERLLAACADESEVRRALVGRALEREERDVALRLVADELRVFPFSTEVRGWAANVYDALSDEAGAVEQLSAATELDPHDADTRVALGQLLLRFDRRAPAIVTLREALALRPQDASTRLLLEQLEPEARPDEAYATAIDEVMRRRRRDGEWSVSTLHDLEVRTVHENGLSSAFHQRVFQIHDDEGAREMRAHGIQYEPGSQWVDVRAAKVYRNGQVLSSYRLGERSLAEPEYRIYYSAREVVVTFPELVPGDVVELRYRIEDVAARNAYVDYFGDFRGLQSRIPTARVEHVFLTPRSRTFLFNTPTLALQHETRVDGETRIDRFVASDVPPLRAEPYMPGYTEVAPYLHVSTYRTWEEVGRFWWGLSQEQLTPDATLERTVHGLVDDTQDVRTRVRRIYAWATDHVRYVGLEFGIHGHKPYRVTDVVERGFGDCKDTAALLYAALKIAGIDARIVLVRTRRNGEIDPAPASLAVFDHAIAYVPALDLYLDGTAEHASIDDLPSMDQGALGLLVGPTSVELRHLPVRTPERTGVRRELTITFTPSGSASLSAVEELRGDEASGARSTFEAAETRAQVLTQSLSRLFSGFELGSQEFGTLTDRDVPVRYTWTGTAPQFGERQGSTVRIAPSTMQELTRAWALLPTRQQSLVLGAPFHYRERRTVQLAGLRVVDVPPGGVADSPFARVSVRYERTATAVVSETEVVVLRERVTQAEYPAFRAFTERADALLRGRLTLDGLGGAR